MIPASNHIRLYPPFTRWSTKVTAPENLRVLLTQPQQCVTRNECYLKTEFVKDGFIARIHSPYNDSHRPVIFARFRTNEEGQQQLEIELRTSSSLIYILSVFSLLIIVYALSTGNTLGLLYIPFLGVVIYLMEWILYVSSLSMIQAEVQRILDTAHPL